MFRKIATLLAIVAALPGVAAPMLCLNGRPWTRSAVMPTSAPITSSCPNKFQ